MPRPSAAAGIVLALAALLAPGAAARAQSAPSSPAPAAADDGKALALARELVRIGYPEDKRAAMFFGAVDAMTSQIRGVTMARFNNDPAAKAIMDRNMDRFVAASKPIIDRHIPAFMDAYAKGYAREFSVPELEALLNFVKTPVGSNFFLRSSAIVADPAFAAANQDYIRELQPQVERMRETLTRELIEHFTKNPPKPTTGS